jgi:hypothetical protein
MVGLHDKIRSQSLGLLYVLGAWVWSWSIVEYALLGAQLAPPKLGDGQQAILLKRDNITHERDSGRIN